MQTIEGLETEINQIQKKQEDDRLEDITKIADTHKMIAKQLSLMVAMSNRILELEDKVNNLTKGNVDGKPGRGNPSSKK